ncbi:hypothetical protein DXX93_16935 [Thalassotalea euphylliae]|uniref:Lipoprotein n=1 Tax=Thalassotalea euphylliae TaxID=1655234 RepID=A0A3E0TUF4_9GAMM|nr:hypothetical protein [Thalassotalea euphylliae]REL28080.1 hypothetical protein DXX93_16935 [Thalassotalea euphylliae]
MFRFIYIAAITLTGCFATNSMVNEAGVSANPSVKALHAEKQTTQEVSSVVSFQATQTISYKNLQLRAINIEDSRCPIGTTCIWAGQMVVTLEVVNELMEKRELTLVHKRKPTIVKAFGFNLSLLGLEPHPKEGKIIQLNDQIISLQITQAK